MHVMFEVKQAAGPAPRPPGRCCWLGARLVKKMLNPKVRWNSRSRNRASQDSETRAKKIVLNRCSVVLLYAHKTLLCYALVHHSYFMLPHSRSILFPVKKMK